jgi:hypothetical protein
MDVDPVKDRRLVLALEPGRAEILYLRSSTHPVLYAIVLRVDRGDGWQAVVSIDNSHEGRSGVDPHHLHRYADGQKQAPEPLPFPVTGTNDAMAQAIAWIADNWEDLAR